MQMDSGGPKLRLRTFLYIINPEKDIKTYFIET